MTFLSPERVIPARSRSVESVAFSPDGLTLATGGSDRSVKLWDVRAAQLTRTLEESNTYVTSVSYSPDGALLASYSLSSEAVKLWDTREWRVRQSIPVADARMAGGAVFSPDGDTIAVRGRLSEIALMDWRHPSRSRPLQIAGGMATCCAFFPDGSVLVIGTSGDNLQGTLELWDTRTAQLRRTLSGFGSVSALACSPDGATIIGLCHGSEVRLWDARSGEPRGSFFTQRRGRAFDKALAFYPDGRMLSSACYGDRVHIWDVAALGRQVEQLPRELQPLRTLVGHRNIVFAVAFSSDGRLLASGSSDDTARVWDAATGELKRVLEGHGGTVERVAFLPGAGTLVTSADATRFWNPGTGQLLRTLEVRCLSVSPDGRLLAAVEGSDGPLTVRDAGSGTLMWTQPLIDVSLHAVTFSPDSRVVASGGSRGTLQLWSADTGQSIRTLSNGDDTVWSLAFAPDGRTLAAACFEGVVELWDPHTGELVGTLYGTGGTPHAVAWSPDNRFLAIGDERVNLWDLETRGQIATLTGEDVAARKYGSEVTALARRMILARTWTVEAVTFSPDGKLVAAGCSDETVKIWEGPSP